MRILIILSYVGLSVALAGCGESDSPVGYWEGSGQAQEVPMDDTFRHLTRSAEFEFWFTLDEAGNAVGEIELDYDAELTVKNLPQVTLPIPGGGITFAPEVGGRLTDLDPRRRFPIVGVLSENNELTLTIAVEEEERETLEFTIRADAGVGGGGVGGAQYGEVIQIDMVPFSPFNGSAPVTKRAQEVYAAHFEEKGKNFAIEWNVHQVRGSETEFEMTPELEVALRDLRRQLSQEPTGEDEEDASQGGAGEAVRLSTTLSPDFEAGMIISLRRITHGKIAKPNGECKQRHLKVAHGEPGIKIDGKGPFPEPDHYCHYGEIIPDL
jgi:hypothetical protein